MNRKNNIDYSKSYDVDGLLAIFFTYSMKIWINLLIMFEYFIDLHKKPVQKINNKRLKSIINKRNHITENVPATNMYNKGFIFHDT